MAFQGQTNGHKGFIIKRKDALAILSKDSRNSDVLKPFLIGDVLVGKLNSQPDRYVIDFSFKDKFEASTYKELYQIVADKVKPSREKAAKEQAIENKKAISLNPLAKVNSHHLNFYDRWWKLSYGRESLLKLLKGLSRVIVTSRVSKRPIFEFCSSSIQANDALMVFAFEDDYTFGILQSKIHWQWWEARCSTLEERLRYTANTVWDAFPFPQNPSVAAMKKVAKAAQLLREVRKETMVKYSLTLRDLYKLIEGPGTTPLKLLHQKLDEAVLSAYGFDKRRDTLAQLLKLNIEINDKIELGEVVQGPGLPSFVKNKADFVTKDCITLL